mgnify:CR=1 FL=1
MTGSDDGKGETHVVVMDVQANNLIRLIKESGLL